MIRILVCILSALAFPLSAAELPGTWKGSLQITGPNGQPQAEGCYMVLKQSGTAITGFVGPDRSVRWSIQNGRAGGARITFAVFPPEGGRLAFDLRLAGNRLTGEARGENQGQTFVAKADLTRTTD